MYIEQKVMFDDSTWDFDIYLITIKIIKEYICSIRLDCVL